MSKLQIIERLAALPEDSPELARVADILDGRKDPQQNAGPWLSLKEAAALVRKHPCWLTQLNVQAACGVRLGGRFAYKVADVEQYLQSAECRARISQLRDARSMRAPPPKKGAA